MKGLDSEGKHIYSVENCVYYFLSAMGAGIHVQYERPRLIRLRVSIEQQ